MKTSLLKIERRGVVQSALNRSTKRHGAGDNARLAEIWRRRGDSRRAAHFAALADREKARAA